MEGGGAGGVLMSFMTGRSCVTIDRPSRPAGTAPVGFFLQTRQKLLARSAKREVRSVRFSLAYRTKGEPHRERGGASLRER